MIYLEFGIWDLFRDTTVKEEIKMAKLTIPEKGTSKADILSEMKTLRGGDARYEDGKIFSLVYQAAKDRFPSRRNHRGGLGNDEVTRRGGIHELRRDRAGNIKGMAAVYGMLAQIPERAHVDEFVRNFLDETYSFK